jgi:hypothetical protein
MNWDEFRAAAPELADVGRELFDKTGLCMLGTIRVDGSPRVTPCEVYIVEGDLMLGMMWQSRKALDLLRDPRLAAHSAQCNKEGTEGDFKLYGRAVDVPEPARRERYGDVLEAQIDWRPSEPYHLFSMDIQSAGYIKFGEGRRVLRWSEVRGLEHLPHPDD